MQKNPETKYSPEGADWETFGIIEPDTGMIVLWVGPCGAPAWRPC